MASLANQTRIGVRARGTVQGVGFRPTVYRVATQLGLAGLVRNDSEGVWIEIEGAAATLDRFISLLRRECPPLGRIDELVVSPLPATGASTFTVVASALASGVSAITPADAATCDACLRELFDPSDRRYRYPFINCTGCGPRYTIVRDVPYDRARTTMAAFPLCALCRSEYEDPADRRFHAEPNACPACGPQLVFRRGAVEIAGDAGLRLGIAELARGAILAVKGLGGYHLAVDATRADAVDRLRQRKHRPHRPLAVMAGSLADAEKVAVLSQAARHALLSPAHPIVLCPARPGSPLAPGVAPALDEVGVMLPYTPLHHLLLEAGPRLLVMTSGNLAEEPIARDDDDARARLGAIADAFLHHDREIHTRADDSVVRIVSGEAQPVRRSRGLVPDPIALGAVAPPILAVGAELKNSVCLTRGDQAYLGPHIGDLKNFETHAFFLEVIDKLGRFLDVTPAVVAHDLHPDYLSTRHALASGLLREPVQHHHAHIASCLVDNQAEGRVLGVAFDGTGCGPAGDLWGGELLAADLTTARRLAHLRPIALPGGEAAIREPWRLAVAALVDAELPLDALPIAPNRLAAVARLCRSAPRATGAGRWFDAVAALAGVRDAISYEGQAAIELEALAAGAAASDSASYPFVLSDMSYDLRPTIVALAGELGRGVPAPLVAARFHRTLADIILDGARRQGLRRVALSGGCFQNRLLSETARRLLEHDGFEVLVHRRVPPNDGGVALGQAAVAAHRHQQRKRIQNVSRHPG